LPTDPVYPVAGRPGSRLFVCLNASREESDVAPYRVSENRSESGHASVSGEVETTVGLAGL